MIKIVMGAWCMVVHIVLFPLDCGKRLREERAQLVHSVGSRQIFRSPVLTQAWFLVW